MSEPVRNLRIRFYGTQGSCSTFPGPEEIEHLLEDHDTELVEAYTEELKKHCNGEGRLDATLEELLDGAPSRETYDNMRRRLDVSMPHIYGGRTTCVHIETGDGYDIVLDAGSGFWDCAQDLQEKWGDRDERHLYLFGSHSHVDHTEGFGLSPVCYDSRNHLKIYGTREFLSVLDLYYGIFSRDVRDPVIASHTPVSFHQMPAKFEGIELRDFALSDTIGGIVSWRVSEVTEPIRIGRTRIQAFEVCHSTTCFAYRIEHGGKKFVFCTDHELRHSSSPAFDPRQARSEDAERRLREHAEGADLLYRDGQYLRDEYDGKKAIGKSEPATARRDWGHSCVEDVVEMAQACGAQHTLVGHHDPSRTWRALQQIDSELAAVSKGGPGKIELARGGTVIDL